MLDSTCEVSVWRHNTGKGKDKILAALKQLCKRHNCQWNQNVERDLKENRLPLGLGNLEFENKMEIPQNQVKVLENTQNFDVYQNDKTNKVL